MNSSRWTVWGCELSPFHLKIISCLRYLQLPFTIQPNDGPWKKALQTQLKVQGVRHKLIPLTSPTVTDQDEFPLVPYLFSPSGNSFYDSTAIATWLDKNVAAPHQQITQPGSPIANFILSLVDEYADEFGLYMVHHMRWKYSATDNNAGKRLATEFRTLIGPVHHIIARDFPKRQVKRLPYLFSVAPEDRPSIQGLHRDLQPPVHRSPQYGTSGATHAFLEDAFDRLLSALDIALIDPQAYIFGSQFTLADASIAGQLGMNLTDPSAASHIERKAPKVYRWLTRIYAGDFDVSTNHPAFELSRRHKPLLSEISRVYVPLMQQNKAAYLRLKQEGETVFNEAAFWQNRSLYRGNLDGTEFTNVAKSFQVKTWNTVIDKWHQLSDDEQQTIHTIAALKIPPKNDIA